MSGFGMMGWKGAVLAGVLAATTPAIAQETASGTPAAPANQAVSGQSTAAPVQTPAEPSASSAAQTAEATPAAPAAGAAPSPAATATPVEQPAVEGGDAATATTVESASAGVDATAAPQPVDPQPAAMAEAANPALPHDLSPWGMFMAADIVVKAVMVGLAFASVVTWTVLVVKLLELWGAGRRAARSLRIISDAENLHGALQQTGKRGDPASQMIRAAVNEYDRSISAVNIAGGEGLKERVTSHLSRVEALAARRIARGTGVLATIGSTAPFVGLFGTVWGIMNSFIGISQAQTTNLAVVAPGIAEALLATAIGLVAAIPAVVIYNLFARAITGYRLRLTNAAAGVERLVSRDIDFRNRAGA